MKKAAILMAAFYLLLITGGYVCIISCGTVHLIERLALNESSSSDCSHHDKEKSSEAKKEKHCEGDKDCSCCKKHGNYTVEENIKPDTNFQILELPAIAINNYSFLSFSSEYSFELIVHKWPKNHAPPPGISIPIFIKLHSLLI